MAITLHALTDDFNKINMTLEVELLQGKHTCTFKMEKRVIKRKHDDYCDWGIPYLDCIGRTLHSPLCLQKKLQVQSPMTTTMTIWGIINSWMI